MNIPSLTVARSTVLSPNIVGGGEASGVRRPVAAFSPGDLSPSAAGQVPLPKSADKFAHSRPIWLQLRRTLTYKIALALVALVSPIATSPLRAAWVYEAANEFFSSADLDGDGRSDLVIVDKATGDYRPGYQLSPGAFTWPNPRASGIEDVTGFSVARFFHPSREALAFAAPAANRVNLFDASSSTSNGLPVTLYPGQSFTLAQDFETTTRVNYTLNQLSAAPAPAVQVAGAGSSGRFLRLIHDGANNNVNVAAFDSYARGRFQSITAEFDFRMSSPDEPADGLAFMLIPTAAFGRQGAGYLAPIDYEEPNIPGVFAVGFDVFHSFGDMNNVSLHWNNAQITETAVPEASVRLASGAFHRAQVTVRFSTNGAFVSVLLTRNINGTPGTPHSAFNAFFVPGLTVYECRPQFGAAAHRFGLNMSADVDNLRVRFLDPLPADPDAATVGPELVTGLDIGGTDNTSLDDLMVWTTWNSDSSAAGYDPVRYDLVRNQQGTNFSSLYLATLGEAVRARANAVTLKTGLPAWAAHIQRGTGAGLDEWRAYDLTSGAAPQELVLGALPRGADYVVGRFGSGPLAQVLFYVPGLSNLWVSQITEPSPGTFASTPLPNHTLTGAVKQIVMLPGLAGAKLLLLFGQGHSASVFNFDGTNAPVLVQAFTAQPGETFTGGAALDGQSVMLFSAQPGMTASTRFQAWNFNGTTYTAGASGALPTLTSLTAPGNVFFFSGEPFVAGTPVLLRTVNARDWSVNLSGLPGNATVLAESFANASNGLIHPLPVVLGVPPDTTTHSLVNQYREPISLFGHGPANGDTVADVSFSPPAGTYASGVSVTIRPNAPGAQVFYRQNTAGGWQSYVTPVHLFKTTTLQAYAGASNGGVKSRIETATYTLTTPPDQLDSDSDGVPDYVELGRGTDPNRPDSDGDGVSDWDELVQGTDPNNRLAYPANVVEKLAAFDLHVRPQPLNLPGEPALAAAGSEVRVHDLTGNLLNSGKMIAPGTNLTFIKEISADPIRRVLAVGTEPIFNVQAHDAPLGRELIGILPVPSQLARTNPHSYGGGEVVAEANAWVTAATALQTSRPILVRELGIADTLTAVLFESSVASLLLARGDTNGANLTLFGARPADVIRVAPTQAALLSLESASNGLPAYALARMALTFSNAVFAPPNADVAALRQITTNIYRVSRDSNNVAAPGIAYPLPLDVLRQFIASGTIHSNYFAGRSLAPEEFAAAGLVAARRAVTNLLAAITPRPTTNLTLQVRPDSFAGPCTLLEAVSDATPWALLNANAAPYRLLDAFDLVPGSRVQIRGFTDAPAAPCSAAPLEVIAVDLVSVPIVVGADEDGDGLADTWESLFQITDPSGDADNDGASNLAEFLAGTDPRDPNSRPPGAPTAALTPPVVHLYRLPDGRARLAWTVPAEWVSRVEFRVLATPDLRHPFTDTELRPAMTAGEFQITVPVSLAARFFMVTMTTR